MNNETYNGKYNGRLNLMDKSMGGPAFHLYDRLPVNSKATTYTNALTGNWEPNLLSKVYFSSDNIKIIQNGLRAGVFNASNKQFLIGNQDEDTLKIIMRSIFLQRSANMPDNITQQVETLNKLVVDYCVPKLLGEADGYIKYKRDVSTMATPIKRPISTNHTNSLLLKNFF